MRQVMKYAIHSLANDSVQLTNVARAPLPAYNSKLKRRDLIISDRLWSAINIQEKHSGKKNNLYLHDCLSRGHRRFVCRNNESALHSDIILLNV